MSATFATRREFLATSTVATAYFALPTAASGSANGRLRLGFIGVGGRAQQHLDSAIYLQSKKEIVEIAAICDVFNRYRDEVRDKVNQGVGHVPRTTADYRELLESSANNHGAFGREGNQW